MMLVLVGFVIQCCFLVVVFAIEQPMNLNQSLSATFYDGTAARVSSLSVFSYPSVRSSSEVFSLLHATDSYLLVGAENFLLNITSGTLDVNSVQKYQFTRENITDCNLASFLCNSYVTAFVRINSSSNLICSSNKFDRCYIVASELRKDEIITETADIIQIIVPVRPQFELKHVVLKDASDSLSHLIRYINFPKPGLHEIIDALNKEANNFTRRIDAIMNRENVHLIETKDKIFTFENSFEEFSNPGSAINGPVKYRSYKTEVTHFCKNEIQNMPPFGSRKSFDSHFYTYLRVELDCSIKSVDFYQRMLQIASVSDPIEMKIGSVIKQLVYMVFNSRSGEIPITTICLFDYNEIINTFNPTLKSNRTSNLSISDCPSTYTSELRSQKKDFTAENRTISDIGLLFYKINGFKITKFLITKLEDENEYMEPRISSTVPNKISSVIYAATDRGSVVRLLHEVGYSTDDATDNHVTHLIDEVKLFNSSKPIKNMKFIRNGASKRLIVITNDEIKSLSLNFCELRSGSCEECVRDNENPLYLSQCYWFNNKCLAERQLDEGSLRIYQTEMCKPKPVVTTTLLNRVNISLMEDRSSTTVKNRDSLFSTPTMSPVLSKTNNSDITIVISFLIAILALVLGLVLGCFVARKHYFEENLYNCNKPLAAKLMLHDLNSIINCIEKSTKKNKKENISADLRRLNSDLMSVLLPINNKKLSNETQENRLQIAEPLSVATFGSTSISSIDNTTGENSPTSITKIEPAVKVNEKILKASGKHSRYLSKQTGCYTIQNAYSSIKDVNPTYTDAQTHRTSSTTTTASSSCNNSSSSTSGVRTSFTNSDTCIFQNENATELPRNNYRMSSNYYGDIDLTDSNSNPASAVHSATFRANMLQNYPIKTTKLLLPNEYEAGGGSFTSIYDNNRINEPVVIGVVSREQQLEKKRQLNLLETLLKAPTKNSYV